MQVLVEFDSGGMITIFPKRSLTILALIVRLRGATSDELHALSDYVFACVFN
jgi:hypothetical protein